jgi:hypothetical protein
MRRIIVMTLALFGAGAALAQTAGWTALFDGKSLDQWNHIGSANWTIVDGVMQADKGSGYLVSKADYTDFELRTEFWVTEDTNSGIFFHCIDRQKIGNATGEEANINDTRSDPKYGTGALVDVAPVSPMPKAGGKWNTMEITVKNNIVSITLNGQKTVDNAKADRFPRGAIALQYTKGIAKFRKVEIRAL